MAKRHFESRIWLRTGLWLAAGAWVCALARAQGSTSFSPDQSTAPKPREAAAAAEKPSQAPAFSVPVEPLGFSPPGPIYLGERNSFVSLDFLDENRLLFTFRVPGLLRREPGDATASEERQIRALVIALPSGGIESETLWTLHDRSRYLWMLNDGHFLLRDRNGLREGDATLKLKPLLQFPGQLLWLDPDPSGQFLATNSRESSAAKAGAASEHTSKDLVVRILRRDSGRVLLVSRSAATVHLPINAEGYLESQHVDGLEWLLKLNLFEGGSRAAARVDSACAPIFDFLSGREILVGTCGVGGGRRLEALTTAGRRLWENPTSDAEVWPLLVTAPDGTRLARETLALTHAVNSYSPIDREEIKGQMIQILNAADGKVALQVLAHPVLDAGGNVALSPSGRRVAVLNNGAIQIYELPAAPPVPEVAPTGSKANTTAH